MTVAHNDLGYVDIHFESSTDITLRYINVLNVLDWCSRCKGNWLDYFSITTPDDGFLSFYDWPISLLLGWKYKDTNEQQHQISQHNFKLAAECMYAYVFDTFSWV